MKEKQIKTVLEVLEVMQKGHNRIDAFHRVAERHDVTYGTISSQCVRELGLKRVYEFDEFAKRIITSGLTTNDEIIEEFIRYQSLSVSLKGKGN